VVISVVVFPFSTGRCGVGAAECLMDLFFLDGCWCCSWCFGVSALLELVALVVAGSEGSSARGAWSISLELLSSGYLVATLPSHLTFRLKGSHSKAAWELFVSIYASRLQVVSPRRHGGRPASSSSADMVAGREVWTGSCFSLRSRDLSVKVQALFCIFQICKGLFVCC
jgi:hypothetical protein